MLNTKMFHVYSFHYEKGRLSSKDSFNAVSQTPLAIPIHFHLKYYYCNLVGEENSHSDTDHVYPS